MAELKMSIEYKDGGILSLIDYFQLDTHLKNNNYGTKFENGFLIVDEDEYYEVGTILTDHGFVYKVVAIRISGGEIAFTGGECVVTQKSE